MTSAELNAAIIKVCDREDITPPTLPKAVPYIGWFWREVDFDAPTYTFGILPGEFKGFMENNKWDYPYTRPTTPDEWAEITSLLIVLAGDPSVERSQAVWDAIQSVGEAPPQRCAARKREAGLPLRCIAEVGHSGEHSFALSLS